MKIQDTLINLCPKRFRLPFNYQYKKFRQRLEKEVLYLDKLLTDYKRAIDIGANEGIYSYALSQLCEVVEAFEPQTWCTQSIVDYSEAHRRNINVYNVGLSNFNGSLILHIPIYSSSLISGLASFREMEGVNQCVEVPVRKLDDYEFTDVSFIKIDVEGYESKVIEGSRNTLLKEKPVILIEIEQRHLGDQPIDTIFDKILELGYEGSFLYKNTRIPLSNFCYRKHQEKFLDNVYSEDYVRNFIFQPVREAQSH